jgi:hypothetical protein
MEMVSIKSKCSYWKVGSFFLKTLLILMLKAILERVQALFPFSRSCACLRIKNPSDSFNISGNNQEAVQTVLKLLTSIGLKTSAKKK